MPKPDKTVFRRQNGWYGCRRDTRDARDLVFKPRAIRLPKVVDLRPHCPPPTNQGNLGSCTGYGVTYAMRYLRAKNGKPDCDLSKLFAYYNARVVEDCVAEDSGAEIRDVIKCGATLGVAAESLWPYNIERYAEKPSAEAFADALERQSIVYRRAAVSTYALKYALATGYPVVIGVSLFESFESDEVAETGVVPMPKIKTEEMVGGHCMLVVGYGQRKRHFTVRNSWGDDWGDKGDCFMPEKYLGSVDYGSDYWVIKEVEM